jgi:uncharacterized protein (TIGR02646 family)
LKRIIKNKEPQRLIEYRNQFSKEELENDELYNDFPYKDKKNCKIDVKNLRRILLEEQGYICCYCMSRIDCDNSKIEHLKPQTKYRKLQLDYKNLFVACIGGEGTREHFCDTDKKDKELKKINLLENIENFIKYEKKLDSIEIYSNDENINSDLNEILNLNASILKKNRKAKWDEVLNKLKKMNFDKNFIKKTLKYFKSKSENGKYPVFCEMIVFFLEKKVKINK